MTIDGSETSSPPDHALGWIGESISYFPTIFDDPYADGDFSGDSWWDQNQNLEQLINTSFNSFNAFNVPAAAAAASVAPTPADSIASNQPLSLDLSKKRKFPDDSSVKAPGKNTGRRAHEAVVDMEAAPPRRPAGNKKGNKLNNSSTDNNSNNKEGRWAEQLLNPCAAAITSRNLSRVQHFLCVLQDLASLKGDANHRLAFHGLRAITHQLSGAATTGNGSFPSAPSDTFASCNPKFLLNSLLHFNDHNPWFRIPNNVANTLILQILNEQHQPTNLHILDIGVSPGLQWPILFEELACRTGGPPPLVQLTVVPPPTTDEAINTIPFAYGPQNNYITSKLLIFAKDMNINLQVNKLDNFHLQNLNPQVINSPADETLIVCAQFRLHNLNHTAPNDERTEFLRVLRSLNPKGVILSENNTDCSCTGCGDFATAFSRRADYLWKFLDSSSVAYKLRDIDGRRMIETEAAKALINVGEMNERKEKWCERMKNAGFKGEVFGEETIDGARALLRKYDNNWQFRVEEKDNCVGLRWKGHPVSFCSLWKTDVRVKECLT